MLLQKIPTAPSNLVLNGISPASPFMASPSMLLPLIKQATKHLIFGFNSQ